MKRVSVVGSTGTGKTTFGRELARAMDVPFTELDAIVWQPKWTVLEPEAFRVRASERIAAPAWVIDGNYGGAGVRDLVWAAADTIVWLDFSLAVIFPRLWRRTMARLRDREELWPNTGNRESWRGAFLSRDSLFWWALKTHRPRRRNYSRLLALPQYAAKTRLRFRTPAEAGRWLDAQREASGSRIHG